MNNFLSFFKLYIYFNILISVRWIPLLVSKIRRDRGDKRVKRDKLWNYQKNVKIINILPELISLSLNQIRYSASSFISRYFQGLLPVTELIFFLDYIRFYGSAAILLWRCPLKVHVVLVPVCDWWSAGCTWKYNFTCRYTKAKYFL